MNRAIYILLAMTVAGCSDILVESPRPEALVLSADTLHLAPDESGDLTFLVRDEDGRLVYAPTATWRALTPTVATVDSLGEVLGVSSGMALVVARAVGVADTAVVVVRTDWRFVDVSTQCRLDGMGRAQCAGATPSAVIAGATQVTGRAPGYYAPSQCVLGAGGTVSCRGSNYYGELGDGTPLDSSLLKLTRDPFAPISGPGGYSAITSSFGYTYCGLRGSEVWCWGSDSQGALGNDTLLANSSTPVLVGGGHSFVSLASDGTFGIRCGVAEGRVWCWGGSNLAVKRIPYAVTPDLSLVKASVGTMHSCALDSAGAAYCWGDNTYGELGRGSTGAVDSIPQAVVTPVRFIDIVATSAGTTCGVSLSNELWCWGRAGNGQLGAPAPAGVASPVRVPFAQRFASVHLSPYLGVCALTTGGAEYCWGDLAITLDTKPEDYLPRRTPSPF